MNTFGNTHYIVVSSTSTYMTVLTIEVKDCTYPAPLGKGDLEIRIDDLILEGYDEL
jgi:hypothetical protein